MSETCDQTSEAKEEKPEREQESGTLSQVEDEYTSQSTFEADIIITFPDPRVVSLQY